MPHTTETLGWHWSVDKSWNTKEKNRKKQINIFLNVFLIQHFFRNITDYLMDYIQGSDPGVLMCVCVFFFRVSLLFRHAESHPILLWIQRNFRCSASCVLYMKVPDREYFLVGQNRLVIIHSSIPNTSSKSIQFVNVGKNKCKKKLLKTAKFEVWIFTSEL